MAVPVPREAPHRAASRPAVPLNKAPVHGAREQVVLVRAQQPQVADRGAHLQGGRMAGNRGPPLVLFSRFEAAPRERGARTRTIVAARSSKVGRVGGSSGVENIRGAVEGAKGGGRHAEIDGRDGAVAEAGEDQVALQIRGRASDCMEESTNCQLDEGTYYSQSRERRGKGSHTNRTQRTRFEGGSPCHAREALEMSFAETF